MQLKEGIFAVKLCELEKEYGLLQSTISICQEKGPDKIRRKLEEIEDDIHAQHRLLEPVSYTHLDVYKRQPSP